MTINAVFKIVTIGTLLCLILGAAAPANSGSNTTYFVDQAKHLETQGNYKDAIKAYKNGLQLDPTNAKIQNALLRSALTLVKKSPDNPDCYLSLCDAYACRGDYDGANRAAEKGLKLPQAGMRSASVGALKKLQMIHDLGGTPHSASAWLKEDGEKILACPKCGRETGLVTVISHAPSPEEKNAVSKGKAYVGLPIKKATNGADFFCLHCHQIFTSAADRPASPFVADMRRRVRRAWLPPKGAEFKKIVVAYTVMKDGSLIDLILVNSSGDAEADASALRAVKAGSPFRPLPFGSGEQSDFEFTFDYKLFKGYGGGEARML